MDFGVFLYPVKTPETRDDNAGLMYRFEFILPHTTKIGFFASVVSTTRLLTDLLFPSFVDFQYSLFHPICRFVGFPVLVHALTHMEQSRLFAVLRPHTIFSFVDAEGNPAVQAFCEYSAGFRH
jgi:hypothetical protein